MHTKTCVDVLIYQNQKILEKHNIRKKGSHFDILLKKTNVRYKFVM